MIVVVVVVGPVGVVDVLVEALVVVEVLVEVLVVDVLVKVEVLNVVVLVVDVNGKVQNTLLGASLGPNAFICELVTTLFVILIFHTAPAIFSKGKPEGILTIEAPVGNCVNCSFVSRQVNEPVVFE